MLSLKTVIKVKIAQTYCFADLSNQTFFSTNMHEK